MSDKNTFKCPMREFKSCVGESCMWAIRFPNGKSSCSVSQIAVNLERLGCAFGNSPTEHRVRKRRGEVE